MAKFKDHINQAIHNLKFLSKTNNTFANFTDWQVTISFYTALHLVNAHLAKFDLQFRSHHDVKDALNPAKQLSVSKLPEDEYIAYVSLQMLSRRSRYLVNEKDNQLSKDAAHFTYDKHLAKAFRHLDKLLFYFNTYYSLNLPIIKIKCPEIRDEKELKHLIKF